MALTASPLKFFLELWAEINRKAALRTRAQAVASLPDPKSSAEAEVPEGTIFEELVTQYNKLGERAEDLIVQSVCGEVEHGFKAHYSGSAACVFPFTFMWYHIHHHDPYLIQTIFPLGPKYFGRCCCVRYFARTNRLIIRPSEFSPVHTSSEDGEYHLPARRFSASIAHHAAPSYLSRPDETLCTTRQAGPRGIRIVGGDLSSRFGTDARDAV